MIRRFRAAIAACIIAASTLGLSLAPGVVTSTAQANHTGNCYDIAENSHQVGSHGVYGAGIGVTGVHARIGIYSSFTYWNWCGAAFGNDGPSSWVALTPTDDSGVQDFDTILQAGLIKCNNFLFPECSYADAYEPRLFYAVGGCDGAGLIYQGDLGEAELNTAYSIDVFKIFNNTTKAYEYKIVIDSVVRVVIKASDPKISCWSGATKQGMWMTETFDSGDGAGHLDGNGTSFDAMRWRVGTVGASWTDYLDSEHCQRYETSASTHHILQCNGYNGVGGDSMNTWTTGW